MIVISIEDEQGAEQAYGLISGELPPGLVQISRNSRGFSGVITNDIIILAAIVSPVAIKAIADVLMSLITSGSNREVSLNGMTLKGYSANDVAELLSASRADSDRPEPGG